MRAQSHDADRQREDARTAEMGEGATDELAAPSVLCAGCVLQTPSGRISAISTGAFPRSTDL